MGSRMRLIGFIVGSRPRGGCEFPLFLLQIFADHSIARAVDRYTTLCSSFRAWSSPVHHPRPRRRPRRGIAYYTFPCTPAGRLVFSHSVVWHSHLFLRWAVGRHGSGWRSGGWMGCGGGFGLPRRMWRGRTLVRSFVGLAVRRPPSLCGVGGETSYSYLTTSISSQL
jgi:hypothetical protein